MLSHDLGIFSAYCYVELEFSKATLLHWFLWRILMICYEATSLNVQTYLYDQGLYEKQIS